MLAEELLVLDADTPLWNAARPLLQAALRLEQGDDASSWHGWRKKAIETFLQELPAHCALLVGVWETTTEGQDVLIVGCICEVRKGQICTVCTFEALTDADLPAVKAMEPGIEHAQALMQATRKQIAPVAWALFTDRATWDEWLFASGDNETMIDKGELLATLAHQGRCVLMGGQAALHHL